MASTYLTRTFQSGGNRKKWTMSMWVKRSGLGSDQKLFQTYVSTYTHSPFDSSDRFQFQDGNGGNKVTSMKFRDTSAWYHIVIAIDTDLATADDRYKIYVNGERITAFDTSTNPSQGYEGEWNKAQLMNIGRHSAGTGYFDGLMSHINFCDGYQYQASDFGETDATTGEWKIKTSPSVSYGTTGFFILKDGNTVTDSSSNSNTWTANGTLTKTESSPSNVFATWNPLVPLGSFSYGNTVWDSVASGDGSAFSTLGAETGKYYMECKITTSNTAGWELGVAPAQRLDGNTNGAGTSTIGGVGYTGDGNIRRAGTTVASGQTTFAQNDIISCALDMDNRKVYFYKNGSALYGGVGVDLPSTTGAYLFATGDWWGSAATQSTANFGNGYFGTTAVSSAGTNASGIGIFEYDVPTGYTALSTKGLNL